MVLIGENDEAVGSPEILKGIVEGIKGRSILL